MILVTCAVVPVKVVPDKVPVIVTLFPNIAAPVTVKPLTVSAFTLSEGAVST